MPENHTDLYSRRFDQYNKHWTRRMDDNVMFLLAQQGWANDLLQARGHVFLNEIQDMLGFDRTPQGQLVGWIKGGKGIDFGIEREVDAEPGVVILNLNPDGVIYDKI